MATCSCCSWAFPTAYDYASDATGPFYTMELLDGSDASTLAPMPWSGACRVLRDVASALALLHARRLVHRDIALARAASGVASSAVVEAAAGLGRTRLLAEFALEARLAGAVVLQAQPQRNGSVLEVAQNFAFRLLAELPAEAIAAAAPYAPTLGHVSPSLRETLGLAGRPLAEMPQAHGEARMRVQAALRDWFLDVACDHTVAIVADDLHQYDEASAAWLAALACEAREHRLLVLGSLRSDGEDPGLGVQALRRSATCATLAPLSCPELLELFRSVFGDVRHLERLADLVHHRAEGNPGHALDLAEHLCREGVITYAHGAWVLPQTVAPDELPANRLDAEVARFGRLPSHARQLGQLLSVREGPLPMDVCAALADTEIDRRALFDGLECLVREAILEGSADGYRFSRDTLRAALSMELDDDRRQRAHRRLGQVLLGSPSLTELDRLKAGVHLLAGGDDEGGSRAVAMAGKHYGLVELADLAPAAPALEAALERLRSTRNSHEMASVLAPLALAGYYADRRYATRYGEQAVDVLQTILGLKLARRLQRVVGRKLGLLVALAWAALGFAVRRRNPRVPTFGEAMMLLFNCVAALTGVCTICTDPAAGRKYASVLEPITALGPDHVATFMHEFCLNLVATVEDRIADARRRWIRMIERLDRPNAVRDLPAHVHSLYLAGALYAGGVAECWRDDSRALACAGRLEALELKLYEMSADQVRMIYYANRGDFEQFDRYRKRVEVHAIQRGTAWQVETWTFSGLVTVYLRTHDAARLKECADQLRRLGAEVPALRLAHTRAHRAYLVERGTPAEAISWQGESERPLERVGWGRGQGVLARAYNALGDHVMARETCTRALQTLTPDDLEFSAMNGILSVELARAEAGLGDHAAAEARLRDLLARHEAYGNALTLGALHEALAEVAALRGDAATFSASRREADRWFRGTGIPSLVARCERLAASAEADSGPAIGAPTDASDLPPKLTTVVHRLRHGGDDTSVTGTAEWVLKQLSEFVFVEEAYLFLLEGGEVSCAARIGAEDHADAFAQWVDDHLQATGTDASVATRTADTATDFNQLEVAGTLYRLAILRMPTHGDNDLVGAVVLPGDVNVPSPVRQSIAERLSATASRPLAYATARK